MYLKPYDHYTYFFAEVGIWSPLQILLARAARWVVFNYGALSSEGEAPCSLEINDRTVVDIPAEITAITPLQPNV